MVAAVVVSSQQINVSMMKNLICNKSPEKLRAMKECESPSVSMI